MTTIIAAKEYEREDFECMVAKLDELLLTVTAGLRVDRSGQGVIDQRQIEQVGLTGLRRMLGDDTVRAETMGLKRFVQVIGLMGYAAKEHKKNYKILPQSRDWMEQGP